MLKVFLTSNLKELSKSTSNSLLKRAEDSASIHSIFDRTSIICSSVSVGKTDTLSINYGKINLLIDH